MVLNKERFLSKFQRHIKKLISPYYMENDQPETNVDVAWLLVL